MEMFPVSQEPMSVPDGASLTVSEFCHRQRISISTYYSLRAKGHGPREMNLGRCVRISAAAEANWIREREEPDDGEARLLALEAEKRRQAAKAAAKVSVKSPKHVSKQRPKGGRS
jgi:hypothetical protein